MVTTTILWIDRLRSVLIFTGLLFGPWAFGTTQSWSISTMNCMGYVLGVLTISEIAINHGKSRESLCETSAIKGSTALLTNVLCVLTCLFLGYVLLSIMNAAADYDPGTGAFEFRKHYWKWLPYTFEPRETIQCLFNYTALACFFWSTVHWVSSAQEVRGQERTNAVLLRRFRALLWLLSISGALLAIEGMIQRAADTGKLLFLVQARFNPGALSQFGPYAYRGNGAQYLNLVWPVTIGFWLSLQRACAQGIRFGGKFRQNAHHLLLSCVVLMIVATMVSASRGGAIITGLSAMVISLVLWLALRNTHSAARWGLPILLIAGIGFGAQLNQKWLKERFASIQEDFVGRESLYEAASAMANDYPVFGTGAGTFGVLFQLYRKSPDAFWPGQLHNDWLETRITFGWVGATIIWMALVLVLLRWFRPGKISASRYLVFCVWIALGGCMLHARWDFPFQIYSIVHLFLTLSALLFSISRRVGA